MRGVSTRMTISRTELHSTLLIDSKGRVYWARLGGDPFSDTAFLTKQLERMNEMTAAK